MPSLQRVTTMSGLPEVADAFAAVDAATADGGEAPNATTENVAVPMELRRMDTMELLQQPAGGDDDGADEPPGKKQRPS